MPATKRPDTFRERALRFVDRLSDLEEAARTFASTNGASHPRRRLVDAAMNLTAAARTLGGRK